MALSVFDLFKIGIGPSSSHTVGPMWAAHRFTLALETAGLVEAVARVGCALYGSLALTGLGHATDKAVLLGLAGEVPDRVDPDEAERIVARIRAEGVLPLMGRHPLPFDEASDLQFRTKETMTKHPNGMRFWALDEAGEVVLEEVYFSVGGGFVLSDAETEAAPVGNVVQPHPFRTADELLAIGAREGLSIADVVRTNEAVWRDAAELRRGLLRIWGVMEGCIARGCKEEGELPGGLRVKRRARRMYEDLTRKPEACMKDSLTVMDWVNLYALAVNEENAAGG
ncbi:MAG: L-serine ammonia-lyase, iron-sulfur-dependent, subunit alpha, partial [Geminicoccaceae bacterium]|nr:L-serine ammonia-lyase, iron-sulfur-dependent, subunit alpha [Geminicoccaceae bacterium]